MGAKLPPAPVVHKILTSAARVDALRSSTACGLALTLGVSSVCGAAGPVLAVVEAAVTLVAVCFWVGSGAAKCASFFACAVVVVAVFDPFDREDVAIVARVELAT